MKKKLLLVMLTIATILIIISIRVLIDAINAIPSTIMIDFVIDYDEIKNYIITSYDSYNNSLDNFKTFVSIKDLLQVDIGTCHERILYAWVLSESYRIKNNNIELVVSSSKPYKFTIIDTNLAKCETIEDGVKDYETLKQIFPDDVIDSFYLIEEDNSLNKDIEQQVREYYKESMNS